MKRILVDTNVILDVLLDRQPHAEASSALWAAIETGSARGLIAAHSVTTIHYLVRKEQGLAKARRTMDAILQVFGVATVDEAVIQEALCSLGVDFEDAVSAASARAAGCDLIVTRDPKGYRHSRVAVLSPEVVAPFLLGTNN